MDLPKYATQLEQWFHLHEADMLAMLERLVNMDTFTSDGQNVDMAGDLIRGWMSNADFLAERLSKNPIPEDESWQKALGHVVMARTHERHAGPGVVFLAHMDTVFPAGTAAARPFKLDRSADRATGPGVLDMKGGLVINMFVARALKELNLMPVPMTLMFSPDEELGSPSTTPLYARELPGALAAICTEPGYPGGGVTIERKGSGHLLLQVTGKAAHAGRAYAEGASAILELAHKILAFDKYVDLPNNMTVNTGLINGGSSANSVAPEASARIHISYKTLDAGKQLVENLRAEAARTYIPGTSSHMSGGIRLPPLEPTPQVRQLFELTCRAGKMIDYPIVEVPSAGTAESGFCSSVLNIPSVCSMGPEGEYLHSPEEYMIVSTFIKRCMLVALTAIQAAHKF